MSAYAISAISVFSADGVNHRSVTGFRQCNVLSRLPTLCSETICWPAAGVLHYQLPSGPEKPFYCGPRYVRVRNCSDHNGKKLRFPHSRNVQYRLVTSLARDGTFWSTFLLVVVDDLKGP